MNDKRDDFNFNIVNCPHICGNILSKPAYGVYISRLLCIGRICSTYLQFKLGMYGGLCRAVSRTYANIFSRFGCSVHKHIQEGICLPATDKCIGKAHNYQKLSVCIACTLIYLQLSYV